MIDTLQAIINFQPLGGMRIFHYLILSAVIWMFKLEFTKRKPKEKEKWIL